MNTTEMKKGSYQQGPTDSFQTWATQRTEQVLSPHPSAFSPFSVLCYPGYLIKHLHRPASGIFDKRVPSSAVSPQQFMANPGPSQWTTSLHRASKTEIIDRLFLYLALCLHERVSEHIAPIMFPPFSLSPIGFSVVEPMGIFFD
jgi:hypothetical protein